MYKFEISRVSLDFVMKEIVKETDPQRYEEKLRDVVQLATAYLNPITFTVKKEVHEPHTRGN